MSTLKILSPITKDMVGFEEAESYFKHAARARLLGVSHRDPPFLVGTAAWTEDRHGRRRFFCGTNYKPKKKRKQPNGRRCCGEEMCLRRIGIPGRHGLRIRAFVTEADHQKDDETGIDLGALLPCKYCRKKFRWHIKNETGVVTGDTQFFIRNVETKLVIHLTLADILTMCPDREVKYERFH